MQSADDAGLQEPLSRISRAGKHLLSLINDVHDLSKIQAGHIQLVPERIELPNFVGDVVLTVDDLAAREGNDLVIEHSSALPTLWTDPLRLRQVLITLLGNSCKFTAQGRICLTAAPSSLNGAEAVKFVVSDTGVGMTDDTLASLFDEFIQAGPSKSQQRGTGLGLAISKRLCVLIRSTNDTQRQPSVGSVFSVVLATSESV